MNQEQADRAAKHYHFMLGVPDHGFVMRYFFAEVDGEYDGDPAIFANGKPPERQDASCGTAACLAGWCCVSSPQDWTYRDWAPLLLNPEQFGEEPHRWTIVNAVDTYRHFAAYFGMTVQHASGICNPSCYEEEDDELTKEIVLRRFADTCCNVYDWDITQQPARRFSGSLQRL